MIKKKKKILRIIRSLSGEMGGPVQGLIHSTNDLVQNDIGVDILTSELPIKKIKNKNIRIFKFGSFSFFGLIIYNIKIFFWIFKNRKNYKHTIIHGIWEFKNLICRFLIKDYSVFVHGSLHISELQKGFIKNIKKKFYWNLIEKKNLIKAKYVILTSKREKKYFRKTFVNTSNIKIKNINYGIRKIAINKDIVLNKFFKKFPLFKNKEFYIYVGRIHPEKGCEIMITAMLQSKHNLLIMGSFSSKNYEQKLKKLINEKKIKNVIFSKAEYTDIKWGALLASKAFISSTHGENFGISIVESMSQAKPIITTNKVNIYQEILNYKAGLITSNKSKNFTLLLKNFEKFSKKKIINMGNNSLKCFDENFNLETSENSLTQLIKKLI
jgi:glycosyltransferase involved in cell wall biosynthesis